MSAINPDTYEPPHASMSIGGVEDIERSLDIVLPQHYRHALLNNPFKGTDLDEYIFWNYTDIIIARNLVNRKTDWYGRGWPEGAFQIGNSCDGGAIFITLSAESSAVFFYHWEMDETLAINDSFKIADSIPEFIPAWQQQTQW